MNRKQVFELELEYVLKDMIEGINHQQELITRSKKRKIIPPNLRYMWRNKCYLPARVAFESKNEENS